MWQIKKPWTLEGKQVGKQFYWYGIFTEYQRYLYIDQILCDSTVFLK